MKFKQYIQSEINQKEVEPSHDAWDRIQARMKNQAPAVVIEKSSKKWWAIAAAVIGLAVCTTVYFLQENSSNSSIQMTQQENTNQSIIEDDTDLKKSAQDDQQQFVNHSNDESNSTPVKNSIPTREEIIQQSSSELADATPTLNGEETNSNTDPKIQKPALASGFKQTPAPQQMATNLDTVKVKKKNKGNYVDPSMLLYSIENKEALKETQKEKTRVAVIDLNK